MREITFDTETTGFEVASGHRIVEIGCVELFDKVRTGKTFHAYINPERSVPKGAQEVHGLSDEFLKDKPLFKEVAADFLDFIGDAMLVAHNANFDLGFINFELKNAGFPKVNKRKIIDTLAIARKLFPGAKVNLDALCKRYEIDLSRRDKHGALLDSELLADVYIQMHGGLQNSMELNEKKEKKKRTTASAKNQKRKFTTVVPTEEELASHSAFIEKMDNALWLKKAS